MTQTPAKPLSKIRVIKAEPISMLNIWWNSKRRRYQVRIYFRAYGEETRGHYEYKSFTVKNHENSRVLARNAAIEWRDSIRELAGLKPALQIKLMPNLLVKLKEEKIQTLQVQVEVEVDLHAINPNLPEGSRFRLATNRDKIREMLHKRQIEETAPVPKGVSHEDWSLNVSTNGLQGTNNQIYKRKPKHKSHNIK